MLLDQLPLTGERKRVLLSKSEFTRDNPHVSPNGHWIAYNSLESGRWEVYVAAFPSFNEKRQVSVSGGCQPMSPHFGRRVEEGRGIGTDWSPTRFPSPAHQTGRARFEHPAFRQTSPTSSRKWPQMTYPCRGPASTDLNRFALLLTEKNSEAHAQARAALLYLSLAASGWLARARIYMTNQSC